ncbi:MAG: hypothetical protein R3C39_01185 [Dehalococcoidia bacterium]
MRADLMEAIDALSAARRLEVWFGTWSLKDVIAHLATWHDAAALGLEQIARGERPHLPGFEGDDDAYNAAAVARLEGESWERLMAMLRAARERHDAAARGLVGAVPLERLEEGRATRRLLDLPATHGEEHIPAIFEWRRAEGL